MARVFASAVRSGDRLRVLRAQRKRLAEELDLLVPGTNPSGVATLMRQLVMVMREIDTLEDSGRRGAEVSHLDELASRRAARAGQPDTTAAGHRAFREHGGG